MLADCFRRHGLPWEILCDNGTPWGTSVPDTRTGLDIWFMRLGITPIHGRPYWFVRQVMVMFHQDRIDVAFQERDRFSHLNIMEILAGI